MAEETTQPAPRLQEPELGSTAKGLDEALHQQRQADSREYLLRAMFRDPSAGSELDAYYDAKVDKIAAKLRVKRLDGVSTLADWEKTSEQERDEWRSLVSDTLEAAGA